MPPQLLVTACPVSLTFPQCRVCPWPFPGATVCSRHRNLSCCNQNPGGHSPPSQGSDPTSLGGKDFPSHTCTNKGPQLTATGCWGWELGATRHMSLNFACHQGISFPRLLDFPRFCSFQKVVLAQDSIHEVLVWCHPGGQLNSTSC